MSRLREAREDSTMTACARGAGVSIATWSLLENNQGGHTRQSTGTWQRIAAYLGVPEKCLYGSVEEGIVALLDEAKAASAAGRVAWMLGRAAQVYGIEPHTWSHATGLAEADIRRLAEETLPVAGSLLAVLLAAVPGGVEAASRALPIRSGRVATFLVQHGLTEEDALRILERWVTEKRA